MQKNLEAEDCTGHWQVEILGADHLKSYRGESSAWRAKISEQYFAFANPIKNHMLHSLVSEAKIGTVRHLEVCGQGKFSSHPPPSYKHPHPAQSSTKAQQGRRKPCDA